MMWARLPHGEPWRNCARPIWNRGPIGGPCALIDHTGKLRTDEDFRGKLLLIYFGYSYCPELKRALRGNFGHSPHQMIASALSITLASEAGTVYRADEIAALCEIVHERSLAVHMDGARFANALVWAKTASIR